MRQDAPSGAGNPRKTGHDVHARALRQRVTRPAKVKRTRALLDTLTTRRDPVLPIPRRAMARLLEREEHSTDPGDGTG